MSTVNGPNIFKNVKTFSAKNMVLLDKIKISRYILLIDMLKMSRIMKLIDVNKVSSVKILNVYYISYIFFIT